MSPRLTVAAVAALCLTASACQREREPSPLPEPPKAAATPPVVTPPPALSRAELLRTMEDAAAAYAAGLPDEGKALVGRQFVVRQAFGCLGPSAATENAADGLARWSWSEDPAKSIELSLTPGDWTRSALIAGAAANWESVEGIWMPRPWLQSEGCPGASADPLASGPQTPSPQSMGLAAVFETGGSRVERRNGRAYRFVMRGKDGQPPAPPEGGYRLVMEGRLVAFADGSAVHCRASNPDQRPVCIGAARLDRVAFEDAAGAVLSEWRPG